MCGIVHISKRAQKRCQPTRELWTSAYRLRVKRLAHARARALGAKLVRLLLLLPFECVQSTLVAHLQELSPSIDNLVQRRVNVVGLGYRSLRELLGRGIK